MGEIPGKDNYGAYIEDDALGQLAITMDPEHSGEVLNAAYYHRYYKVNERGAMGQQLRHRGFSDSNLWMAMNTQPKVAGQYFIDVLKYVFLTSDVVSGNRITAY